MTLVQENYNIYLLLCLPVASRFSSFLPLMHRELAKSFPLIIARIQRSDWVGPWVCVTPGCVTVSTFLGKNVEN